MNNNFPDYIRHLVEKSGERYIIKAHIDGDPESTTE